MSTNKKWMVIDTDAGIDDAIALCLAFKNQKNAGYEIRAITCVQGNTSVSNVRANAAKCRALFGDNEIPVLQGAETPLSHENVMTTSYFHGNDGLGDVKDIEEPEFFDSDSYDAVQQIVKICSDAETLEKELMIVTLGPLTNIALAMRSDPNLYRKVTHLFVMGGCGNARGNATRIAEYNFHNDVDAAFETFLKWEGKMTVISWDLCIKSVVPWEKFDQIIFDNTRNNVGNFLGKICVKAYGEQNRDDPHRSSIGAVVCDAVCVACAIDQSLIEDSVLVNVEIDNSYGICRGMSVLDLGHTCEGVVRDKRVLWVTKINIEKYIEMLDNLTKT